MPIDASTARILNNKTRTTTTTSSTATAPTKAVQCRPANFLLCIHIKYIPNKIPKQQQKGSRLREQHKKHTQKMRKVFNLYLNFFKVLKWGRYLTPQPPSACVSLLLPSACVAAASNAKQFDNTEGCSRVSACGQLLMAYKKANKHLRNNSSNKNIN